MTRPPVANPDHHSIASPDARSSLACGRWYDRMARRCCWLPIGDAFADSRFNPEVDRQTGFRTQSILCVPLRDHAGKVFAVTQLLNRNDGQPFDESDEKKFSDFAASLGVILETLHRLHGRSAS